MTKREALILIDQIERALASCKHPYATTTEDRDSWCNVCGAHRLNGLWCAPHWRDILVPLLLTPKADSDKVWPWDYNNQK